MADDTLKKVAELSGGKLYHAADIDQLKDVYATLQNQFGYETTPRGCEWGLVPSGCLRRDLGRAGRTCDQPAVAPLPP